MPYTVYKVTNLVTQDFYIGVHKTEDPNDAYLGSGKIIREQVARLGPEHFRKDILASFDKRREAYRLEAELVEPLLGTPGCLNIHPGGHGGFGYINTQGLGDQERASAAAQVVLRVKRSDPEWCRHHAHLIGAGLRHYRALYTEQHGHPPPTHNGAHKLRGRPLSDAHRLAIKRGSLGRPSAPLSAAHRLAIKQANQGRGCGVDNPNFGARWFHDPTTGAVRLVIPAQQAEALSAGWVLGRKPRQPSPPPHPRRQPRNPPECPLCGKPQPHRVEACICPPCTKRSKVVQARELAARGASHIEIAEALGVTTRSVRNYVPRASSLTQSPGLQIQEASAQEPT